MIDVLLVEDDEGDAFLFTEAMNSVDFDNALHHARDGIEAQEFLNDPEKPIPAFLLLDLNMPRMGGHDFLKWIKGHEQFKEIPVGILTTSSSEDDISKSYKNYANYFITKPGSFDDLKEIVWHINEFWVGTVDLPGKK